MEKNNIKILDCTLRDGGYCNDWNFGLKNIQYVIRKLISAEIDIVECGFLSQTKQASRENSIFCTVSSIKEVLPEVKGNTEFVCMINYGEYNIQDLEPYDGTSIDSVRVAFHKQNMEQAIKMCSEIKAKGYGVYVQPMVTMNYSDAEILQLIAMTNRLQPKALYIVDSFGVVRRRDLLRMYYLIDHNLSSDISIGYHSHNNLQLAYSNAQALSEIHSSRAKIIDSSVFGMGRGAGNLNTELFVEYLNDYIQTSYTVFPLLQIIDNVLNKIYYASYWGYSLPHYLSSKYNCHPNYASYLSDKSTLTIESIGEILEQIPPVNKINFDKSVIEGLYISYQESYEDDSEVMGRLEKELLEKNILILAPGKTIKSRKTQIDDFIREKRPTVISVNFVPADFNADYVFFSNLKRYNQFFDTIKNGKTKIIATSNIKQNKTAYTVNYGSLRNNTKNVEDNVTLMLLRLLIKLGVKEASIAGFDGYEPTIADNYADKDMFINTGSNYAAEKNSGISSEIKKLSSNISIDFITPTKYVQEIL